MQTVNLAEKFGMIDAYWTPKVIGEANNQLLKIAKGKGDFVWHTHDNEDEVFIIVRGELTISFRDRPDVRLGEGELFVVPRGVEHKPHAVDEAHILLFEPKGTAHTGVQKTPLTLEEVEWI